MFMTEETEWIGKPAPAAAFATTHWSVVVEAREMGSPRANEPIARLCKVTNVLPAVVLLSPTNSFVFQICQPVSFNLTAQAVAGTFPIDHVEYYDGATLIGQSSSTPSFAVLGASLGAGVHNIVARVVDTGGQSAVSATAQVTLLGPALNQMMATRLSNGELLGCMGTQPGSNYVIYAGTNLQNTSNWQPVLTNRPSGGLLLFPNQPGQARQFFRAQRVP
jgi:hypothetical protein